MFFCCSVFKVDNFFLLKFIQEYFHLLLIETFQSMLDLEFVTRPKQIPETLAVKECIEDFAELFLYFLWEALVGVQEHTVVLDEQTEVLRRPVSFFCESFCFERSVCKKPCLVHTISYFFQEVLIFLDPCNYFFL